MTADIKPNRSEGLQDLNEYFRAVLKAGKIGERILTDLQKIRIINHLLINNGIRMDGVGELQFSLGFKTTLKNCPVHGDVLWIEIDRVFVCPEPHESERRVFDDARLPSAGINRND